MLASHSAATRTGRDILSRDWTGTELGPVETWPRSLTAVLDMMLACPTAMFLAWGPDLRCFFNDAYRPILGTRLDTALGAPFREVWANIWDDLVPLVDATLRGESVTATDMHLDLARHGEPEDSWWTFSYSPVFGEDGNVAGLFCATLETTSVILANRERDAADARLQQALSSGRSIGAWDWDVARNIVQADARFALLYDVDPDIAAAGASIETFFGGIDPEDLPGVEAQIARAMDPTGDGTFVAEYRIRGRDGRSRWVSAQGRCAFDGDGNPVRFPGVSYDIDDRKQAQLALQEAKAERDFVIALSARQRASVDPEAIMRFTAQAIGTRLRVNRACFFRMAGANLRYVAGWNDGTLAPLEAEEPLEAFGRRVAERTRDGQAVISSDFRADTLFDPAVAAGFAARSGAILPVMRDGVLIGGLMVGHGEVRVWTEAERSLLGELAELTWLAVERAEALLRLEARIGQQDRQLRTAGHDLYDARTAQRSAEGQVRQLQKMEAVGQLTGGIAHDFNNMLAVVIGALDMIERRSARGETDNTRYLSAAKDGARRAASLTQRLLAFARQSPLAPEPIEGNRLVQGLTDLFVRTLGEKVALETVLGAGLWRTEADPSQLENVLLNLAVNARDAMAAGGKLTIETANAHVGEEYAREAEIAPGQYVLFAVTDTGEGMPADVLAQAFDPFFTTKGVGKGTGLGLSQVFGFVRQSRGHVRIYSEPGVGTTVRIYLPRFYGDAPTPVVRPRLADARGGRPEEVILVVEDEGRVRSFSVEVLRELGYTVVHAASGEEALAMIGGGQGATLLFTDIVMPGMNGRELADRAVRLLPGLRVLYTTGYTRNAVVHNGVLDPGTQLLSKPFGVDDLARKVREVIDG